MFRTLWRQYLPFISSGWSWGSGTPTEPQSHLPKGTLKTSLPLMTLCHSPIPKSLSVSFPLSLFLAPDRNSNPKGNGEMKRTAIRRTPATRRTRVQRLCKHILAHSSLSATHKEGDGPPQPTDGASTIPSRGHVWAFTSLSSCARYVSETTVPSAFSPVAYRCETQAGALASVSCRLLSVKWVNHRVVFLGSWEGLTGLELMLAEPSGSIPLHAAWELSEPQFPHRLNGADDLIPALPPLRARVSFRKGEGKRPPLQEWQHSVTAARVSS